MDSTVVSPLRSATREAYEYSATYEFPINLGLSGGFLESKTLAIVRGIISRK